MVLEATLGVAAIAILVVGYLLWSEVTTTDHPEPTTESAPK